MGRPEDRVRRSPSASGPRDDGVTEQRSGGRAKSPLWAKLLLTLGVLLTVTSTAVILGGRALIANVSASIPQQTLLPVEVRATGTTIEGPLNILLLGMDERAKQEDTIRTDTMIIAHVPANHDAIYLVSLPRDWLVDVPAFQPASFAGGQRKLTEAFQIANTRDGKGDLSPAGRQRGVSLTAQTISQLVPGGGLRFNAVALIDFKGFEGMVRAIDGVEMCVDQDTTSLHYDDKGNYVSDTNRAGVKPKTYRKGFCGAMRPWEALDYVRQRKSLPNGDYDRQRHQQQFLHAVFEKMTSRQVLTDIGGFNELKSAAGQLFTLDLNGIALEDWIFSLRHLGAEDIQLVQQNAGKVNPARIGGVDYEIITETNRELLTAVREDRVFEFLSQHPDWIARLQ